MNDPRLDKLEAKIDKITDSLHSIDKTLAKQEENLKEHMRRSLANEKAVEVLSNELKPVKAHINRLEGGLKLIGVGSLLITVVTGAIKLISLL